MQYIFHGDDYGTSRTEFNQYLDNCHKTEILRLDNKQIDLDKINNFINGESLFGGQKILAVTNFFTISKPILDKLIPIINQSTIDIIIWQDKVLTQVQLKTFPKATVFSAKLNNTLFQCLNTIRPGNLKNFLNSYERVDKTTMYDLFLYLLKNNLRKQLIGPSSFNPRILKTTYLQLIELDYQNKSGQLTIPKEIALERIMINLIKN